MSAHIKDNAGIINVVFGILTIGGSILVYWLLASSVKVFTNPVLHALKLLAYLTFSLSIVGLCASLLGIKLFLSSYASVQNSWPSLTSLVGRILGTRKYLRTLLISAVLYGLFYAAVSSIIIYRPDRNFAADYFVNIPSIVTTVCCDGLGFIPIFTVYLTNHLGLLLIPMNVILMIVVSLLVGHNVALGHYAFDNKPKGVSVHWLGGFGAITGLFTACPTCAGLFLGSLLQTAGTEALAVTLALYQPWFVGLTFLILVGSNYLLVRNIRQALYGNCRLTPNST
jgi:hypothetical protein